MQVHTAAAPRLRARERPGRVGLGGIGMECVLGKKKQLLAMLPPRAGGLGTRCSLSGKTPWEMGHYP